MGLLRVPFLLREKRLDLARVPRGPAWAFPMGMAFAVGWTPCIGPALATIVATASVSGTAVWGGVLLALYSLRSEEHTSELQSLMRISYAVFCLKKKKKKDD